MEGGSHTKIVLHSELLILLNLFCLKRYIVQIPWTPADWNSKSGGILDQMCLWFAVLITLFKMDNMNKNTFFFFFLQHINVNDNTELNNWKIASKTRSKKKKEESIPLISTYESGQIGISRRNAGLYFLLSN